LVYSTVISSVYLPCCPTDAEGPERGMMLSILTTFGLTRDGVPARNIGERTHIEAKVPLHTFGQILLVFMASFFLVKTAQKERDDLSRVNRNEKSS
ncbi:MAG: hypothetical protein JSU72_09385, partial [Deltaproteobacteria bacterium]